MPSFEETLARMKGLYTYGKEINESNNLKTHTLEYHAVGADGVNYGIVRECNKYYIKSAPKGKETIAEAYEYLGGFCNKGNYEYSSYANALKQFELKMASINEAHDSNVNISTLDPFKKGDFLIEGTDKMRNEIARQRQIMYNVSMLMNESTEIGADRKDDVVKFDGKNPEAETGKKGDEGGKKAAANPAYAGSKTNGVDKKAAPFKEGCPKCADQLKEEAAAAGKDTDINGARDWNEGFKTGMNPKDANLFVDGAKTVNEEEGDWGSKGLPGTPGVGEADTDHNDDPFNKGLSEAAGDAMADTDETEGDIDDLGGDEELGGEGDLDVEDNFDTEDFSDDDDDDLATDTDFDAGVEDVEDVDVDDEDGLEGDDLGGDDDIMAQIEELQAQIDALKAQIGGGEDAADDVDGFDAEDDSLDADDDFDAEGDDLDTDDDFDAEGDDDFDAEGDDFGTEDDDLDGDDADDLAAEDEMGDDEDSFDDDMDEGGCVGGNCPAPNQMMESKRAKMNSIIENVVKRILSEDELHDFGKHPGYRKKPMELPSTGEDKNQWGRDWNDDSVHNEQPFGEKVGNGDPFNQLVDAVTKDVMYQLRHGATIKEGVDEMNWKTFNKGIKDVYNSAKEGDGYDEGIKGIAKEYGDYVKNGDNWSGDDGSDKFEREPENGRGLKKLGRQVRRAGRGAIQYGAGYLADKAGKIVGK